MCSRLPRRLLIYLSRSLQMHLTHWTPVCTRLEGSEEPIRGRRRSLRWRGASAPC
jgi:hypothetical protein